MNDKHHETERPAEEELDGDRDRYAREHPAGYLLSARATSTHTGTFGGLQHGAAHVHSDGREHCGHPLSQDEPGYGAQGRLLPGGGRHPYELTGPARPEPRVPRNYVRADEPIYEDIWERLVRLSELELNDVMVRVTDGCVTLSGHVPDRFSKYIIEEVTASVFGVRNVNNVLRVG